MGGSSGTTTTTQNNTPFNSSQLLTVQNRAIDLLNNNPLTYYPGTTYALPNTYQTTGYNDAASTYLDAGDTISPYLTGLQSSALNANTGLTNGQFITDAKPWLDFLTNTAYGGNPAQSAVDSLMGFNDSTAAQSLSDTASGKYLGSNPYLDPMYDSAADAVVRKYQTATSPLTDSAMIAANRFGSGASANATSTNEANLGKTLGDLSADLYGNAYNYERGLQNQAAYSLGNLSNTAYGTAGTLGVTGTNALTSATNSALDAWNNLIKNQQSAINASSTLGTIPASDYQAAIKSGEGLQTLDQSYLNDLIARYYGEEYSPWATLQSASGIVGGAIPGITTTQQPYYTNTFGQVLGGVSSGLGIGKALLK
jgi:hypothetical protein